MKRISHFLIPAVFILTFVQNAQAQSDTCKVLMSEISGTYSGHCLNGLANGKGKSAGKDTYTGNFKDGLPDGKGKYEYSNGDVFDGNWANGLKNGKGKFQYTLNGKKMTLQGYWKNGDYAGQNDPDVEYRITGVTGISDYKLEKSKAGSDGEKTVTITISSAFQSYIPRDLKIEKSSGQVMQQGKSIAIAQFSVPFHCDISYTILVAHESKQCRFSFDIYQDGTYVVVLNNQ